MDPPLYDDLAGQVALVTGANRGIGHAIASGLQALGATVVACSRDPARVTAKGQHPLALDLTEDASITAALEHMREEHGQLDILVNNAAVIGASGRLGDIGLEGLDAVLDTNVRGTIVLTQAALPLLLERPGGRVVNLSSGAGSFGEGQMTSHLAYSTSKAAVNAFTVILAQTYVRDGLIANAVCPGWVRTDMGGGSAPRSPEKGAETPVWLARFREGGPSGRFWRDLREIEW